MTAEEDISAEKTEQQLQDELDALNAKIAKHGSIVRQMKKDGAAADEIGEAIQLLQNLKIEATQLTDRLAKPEFNRKSFDDLLLRKMFVIPSFEIHGGVKGLFDLGPPACALKVSDFFLKRGESRTTNCKLPFF